MTTSTALLATLLQLVAGPVSSLDGDPGLVVVEVTEQTALAHAGGRVGDILLHWSLEGAAGTLVAGGSLRSGADAEELGVEHAPRGPIRLDGLRDGEPLALQVPLGHWDLVVRPRMPAAVEALYEEAPRHPREGELPRAIDAWRRAIDAARGVGRPDLEAWLLTELGLLAIREGAPALVADTAFEGADALDRDPDGRSRFFRRWARAKALRERGEYGAAEAILRALLENPAYPPRASLARARVLNEIGVLSWFQGALDGAEESLSAALQLRRTLAPNSLPVASTHSDLGIVAWSRGDLAEAERRFRRGMAIKQRLAPGSFDYAYSLTNLGMVYWRRGDLPAAELAYREALGIYQRQKPGRHAHARALGNLALVLNDRGDLAGAERLYHEALAIWEREAPLGTEYVHTLSNIGLLAASRGDLVTAERLLRRGLEGKKRLGREHRDLVTGYLSLGQVLFELGRLTEAEVLLLEAARIGSERLAQDVELGEVYRGLGELAERRADLALAEAHYRKALELALRFEPQSLAEASQRQALARVRHRRGDPSGAESLVRPAVALFAELAPGTTKEAFARRDLAMVLRDRGRLEDATTQYRLALDALERQRPRVGGGDELRSQFEATLAPIYWGAIDLFVTRGRYEDAFRALERSRARAFLETLATRDLGFEADLSPELARQRRLLVARYDDVVLRLGRSRAGSEETRRLARELETLRGERADLLNRIGARSPRVAGLERGQPVDVDRLRGALDPDTLVLAYSIGERASFLFTLGSATGLHAYPLPTDRQALAEQVLEVRGLLAQPSRLRAGLRGARLAALSELLLGPAAPAIAEAGRLLILPDGPLHTLPFGVLRPPGDSGASYLVEQKSLHVAPSATAYAELRRHPRGDGQAGKALAAFGDPLYPGTRAQPPVTAAGYAGGALQLGRLPESRREVERLARLFGASADVFLGREASEERVKAIASGYRWLHFAGHAALDRRFPLDSALILSIPDDPAAAAENGVLQAWEILEELRIDAELVVLSACETGLGRELAGEGILGLTRAFFHAGARSVLASLWRVEDSATADLMERFYGHLRRGRSKDDALRLAQLDLLERPASADPHYWAAFVLHGDRR